jgi:hypothetical protein
MATMNSCHGKSALCFETSCAPDHGVRSRAAMWPVPMLGVPNGTPCSGPALDIVLFRHSCSPWTHVPKHPFCSMATALSATARSGIMRVMPTRWACPSGSMI